MPLLGGLFSRKNKSSSRSKRDDPTDSIHSSAELESAQSSPTTSTYHPSQGNPTSYHSNSRSLLHPNSARGHNPNNHSSPLPSVPPTNGSKIRLPFGRKKSSINGQDSSTYDSERSSFKNIDTSQRPAQPGRSSTDIDASDHRRLRPPPSRSAIFAAYGDPDSALSTRSLPNDSSTTSNDFVRSQSSTPPPQKRPSLFPWSRTPGSPSPSSPSSHMDTNSMTNLNSGSPTTSRDDGHSFNLKSFRHIRPPSPNNGSNVSLAPPVPRPRGQSINSDSSQRISVAAFREAQARRSLAGSPSPSFRSQSPAPGLPTHTRGTSPENARDRGSPRPSHSTPSIPGAANRQRQRTSLAMGYTSESDSEPESSEDSDGERTQRPGKYPSSYDRPGRTGNPRAKSEIGHGHASDSSKVNDFPQARRAPQSHIGHSSFQSPASQPSVSALEAQKNVPDAPPRSQSGLSHYSGGARQRASASTSALMPSAAAHRASILVASNSTMNNSSAISENRSLETRTPSQPPPVARTINGHKVTQKPIKDESSSDSDSEDNAPLASLVAPRRPGSAMSSYSNLHSRSTGTIATRSNTGPIPKPLIDINELTGPKRPVTSPIEKGTPGFTDGPTLLSQGRSSYSQSPLVESPTSPISPWQAPSLDSHSLTRKDPPVHFVSPPGTPAKELELFMGSSSSKPVDNKMSNSASSPHQNQEQPRDPITERLTKVVKKSISILPGDKTVFANITTEAELASSRANSSSSGDSSELSNNGRSVQRPLMTTTILSQVEIPSNKTAEKQKDEASPVDQELAQLIGAGLKFMSQNGETSDESSESSDSDEEEIKKPQQTPSKDRIVPIPVKQVSPPLAFSVTSRPPLLRNDNMSASGAGDSASSRETKQLVDYATPRPRSTTLFNSPSSSTVTARKSLTMDTISTHASKSSTSTSVLTSNTESTASSSSSSQLESSHSPRPVPTQRSRSSTLLTGVPLSSQMTKPFTAPQKPFAARRNSPASSTGDSSSGRAPLTPRDGSDIAEHQDSKSKKHEKRRSVSFGDDIQEVQPPSRSYLHEPVKNGSGVTNEETREQKRRERRRSEAKASIELGNVINGRGPFVDDDDDMPINQTVTARMSTVNPLMAMNPMAMQMGFGQTPTPGWGAGVNQSMLSPAQFMVPPPADPNFFAAHQQAMQIAKQAYQMAVAQQAMAAAADEWERGSAIGGFGGGSVYGGGGSVYGGSTYGNGPTPSMYGMMNMNMMQAQAWPSSASVYGGTRSVYGASLGPGDAIMSSSRSEYGGVGDRGGNVTWSSSRSSYGEFSAPSARRTPNGRDSGYFPPVPAMPTSVSGRTITSSDNRKNNTRLRTASQPATPGRTRKAPPPSSWKANAP